METLCYLVRPCAGGIEAHLKVLINHLSNRYRIVLIAPGGNRLLDRAYLPGVEQAFGLPLSGRIEPGKDLYCLKALKKILFQVRPSLMHAHGYKAALLGCLAGRIARVPVVVTVHNFPSVRSEAFILSKYFKALDKFHEGPAQQFITVSESLALYLHNTIGVPAKSIHVVHNGIDPLPFEAASRDKTRKDLRRLLFESPCPPVFGESRNCLDPDDDSSALVGTAARLAPQKGLEVFIKASAILSGSHPSVHFVIIGEGPLFTSLQKMVLEYDLGDRFFFTGYHSNISAAISALDVFVLPSISEGLSITLMEALAAAKPVVATRTGGIPEIVDEETGLLVAPGNSRDMAAAISKLLTNPIKARQMAEAGKRRVKTHFSLTKMFNRTESIYREMLECADSALVRQSLKL